MMENRRSFIELVKFFIKLEDYTSVAELLDKYRNIYPIDQNDMLKEIGIGKEKYRRIRNLSH